MRKASLFLWVLHDALYSKTRKYPIALPVGSRHHHIFKVRRCLAKLLRGEISLPDDDPKQEVGGKCPIWRYPCPHGQIPTQDNTPLHLVGARHRHSG